MEKKWETFSQHVSTKKLYRRLMLLNFASKFWIFYIKIKKITEIKEKWNLLQSTIIYFKLRREGERIINCVEKIINIVMQFYKLRYHFWSRSKKKLRKVPIRATSDRHRYVTYWMDA